MMTLQGNPHLSAAKGIGRGNREGMSGKTLTPNTFQMVTANFYLSNIFLRTGQGVEKTGESDIRADARRGERLE
jgi:hypothetical protein